MSKIIHPHPATTETPDNAAAHGAGLTFNPEYKPNRDNLSPATVLLMDRAFYRNRAAGLNVQFHHEDGHLDEWSFNTPENRDAFAASLARQGVAYAFSEGA